MSGAAIITLTVVAIYCGVFLWFLYGHKLQREPKTGEQWILRGKKGDPWSDKDARAVPILDVKDGWVRYSIGSVFNDERMKIGTFIYCYRFHAEAAQLAGDQE